MSSSSQWSFILTLIAISGLATTACQSAKHTMIEARPGMSVICTQCYDEAVRVRQITKFGTYAEMHAVHQCPSCNAAMSTYVEDGVVKIKCAGCAPEGLDCDKCLPSGRLGR